jgi:hypothetical protein
VKPIAICRCEGDSIVCHCEERSDEAISPELPAIATPNKSGFAMTREGSKPARDDLPSSFDVGPSYPVDTSGQTI